MRIELVPGTTNVVRFLVERRLPPTLELLRDLAPDVREVLVLAEAFGMEPPVYDLRERTDTATAEHILNQVPVSGAHRETMLRDLEEPMIARAVAASRAARDASLEAAEAEQALERACSVGHLWIEALRERAERLAEQAARLVLEAHARAEEVEGMGRAVAFARRGESWTPRDHEAEADVLIEIGRRLAG